MNVEEVKIEDLKPHPRNYREHGDEQLTHIAKSIEENGFYRNVVVALDNTILAGHGVVAAAKSRGEKVVPVVRMNLKPDDVRALKILAGDNEVGRLAGVDDRALASILDELKAFDVKLLLGTGFTEESLAVLDALLAENTGIGGGPGAEKSIVEYTKRIESPVYKVTGECPKVTQLYDAEKAEKLCAEIENPRLTLTPDEREFLKRAAQRHVVYDYRLIAEFYAHAPKEVQRLMEQSALVVVDFNQAIENGFVKLTKNIADSYAQELEHDGA